MIPDASVPNFVQIWSPLVAEMGATVVSEIPKGLYLLSFSIAFFTVLSDMTISQLN